MYNNFFGLTDTPFSIAPNPDYLYLSPRHKEALAHLTFGLRESGGFVMLTGEVGTGKTTVSRKLLLQLPTNTKVALILNPTLSAIELLATVCDELEIDYQQQSASLKFLTDRILEKLSDNHINGLSTVLFIDEAQHLQPEVLEQLRLLTNLETNREKLLKVVLIGQPELQLLLKRNELRQLAQRITARYHLLPLEQSEVKSYIMHRLQVADGDISIFPPRLLTTIFKLSSGIPRIINLLCDRALTLAYIMQKPIVTRSIILAAADQVLGKDEVSRKRSTYLRWINISVFTVAVILGYWIGTIL